MSKPYLQLGKILSKLLYLKRMNSSELARAINLPVPTIHRLVTGKSTRPYSSSLDPIAQYFGITTDQLLGLEPLPVMTDNSQDSSTILKPFHTIPLLTWESLGVAQEQQQVIDHLVVGNMSKQSFALYMPDFSMEPLFEKGCTLIFDPTITYSDRSYILIRMENNIYIFRQLLIDGNHKYIKSLNPDISATSLRALRSKDKIIACLIETRSTFQPKLTNS